MPSPVGHMLAGVAVAWTIHPRATRYLTIAAAMLAASPDLDLLLPVRHRTFTHSIAAALFVTILAIGVTRQVTMSARLRVGVICGLAIGSHLLLDLVSVDNNPPRGIQAFWPISDTYVISDTTIFRPTERRDVFSASSLATNALAVLQELAIAGPIVLGLWWVRIKALARLPPKLSRRDHPSK